jgi:hypothetical protein
MDGIQFIVNEQGEKKAVIINLEQWGNLWLEISQKMQKSIEDDHQEEWLKDPDLQHKLDQALEWNFNNPSQVSDLEVLAKKFNIDE